MKKIISTLCLLSVFFASAQTIQKFYDWQWKPCEAGMARFFSQITHTDSGWNREDFYLATKKLQMKGLYKDSACKIYNGWFTYYFTNGNISSKGLYVNNKKEGLWLYFHYNGVMSDSSVYESGQLAGISMGWHNNGYMSDSSVYNNDGSAVHVNWFDNGTPSSAGRTINSKKMGKWRYFHKNGIIAAMEDYLQDKMINRIYYDEEGKPLVDTTNKDRDAEFKGGIEKWKKFLLNNLAFPSDVKLINTDVITVVIAATVDEEGNITDAYVDIPFNQMFDNEALRVMKKSPKWVPAIRYNRKVKMFIRQPVSFDQSD